MANWQRTLKLNPEWSQAQAGEITHTALAAAIAIKLAAVRPLGDVYLDEQKEELTDEFASAGRDEDTTVEDIDGLMFDLYEWGDTPLEQRWNGKKVCWVDTISGAS